MNSRIIFHNKKQIKLTEKYLVNKEDFLYDVLSYIRKKIDEIYKNQPVYPEGYCCEISDKVFEILNSNKTNVKSLLNEFKKFEKKGLIFKRVYGIQDGKYFQNGIQLGDYFLDVSNDTVDIKNDSVEISRLGSSGMENFSSYERYAEIVEKYWGFEVYPNIYFPVIAPTCPMLFIDKKGKIILSDNHTSILKDDVDNNNLKLAEDFLLRSKYSNKRLPEEYINKLSKKFSYKERSIEKFINNHEMALEENIFDYIKNLYGDDFLTNFIKYRHSDIIKVYEKIKKHIKN